jgi:hypothetical protein
MMASADERLFKTLQPAGRSYEERGIEERIRIPGSLVARDQLAKVRKNEPQKPSVFEHAVRLVKKRQRCAALQMLQHVRTVDSASRGGREW